MKPIEFLNKINELCQDQQGLKGTMVFVVHHPMTITKEKDGVRHEDTKSNIMSYGVQTPPQMRITMILITEWLADFMRKTMGITISGDKKQYSEMRRAGQSPPLK